MALIRCSECGESISDRAVMCPKCGAPPPGAARGALPPPYWMMGIDVRVPAGAALPMIHIATGVDPATGQKRIARGIVAIGDVAFGVVALGGVAVGGISFRGLSLSVVAVRGGAIGLGMALGGLAIGTIAIGGAAIGYYAMGGGAFGAHVVSATTRDPEAMRFFGGILSMLH